MLPSPALIIPAPVLITPFPGILAFTSLPVNRFHDKLALNVPNYMPRNPRFCSFASFLIVLLTPFIIKPYFSRDLTISMISVTSSFKLLY